jgi:hypothetical protein
MSESKGGGCPHMSISHIETLLFLLSLLPLASSAAAA